MKTDYEETVLRYKDIVYRIAFARCPCRQDAEDVFQDVFFALCRCRKDFESDEHLRNWLIRVTLNFCRLLRRQTAFRKKAELSGDIPDMSDPYGSENAMAVIEAVRDLPEKYGALVEMFYFEEMSCAEIGSALKMNEATVRTRLRRGRELLRKKLENDMEVSDYE